MYCMETPTIRHAADIALAQLTDAQSTLAVLAQGMLRESRDGARAVDFVANSMEPALAQLRAALEATAQGGGQ
jgi:hypothetical protein